MQGHKINEFLRTRFGALYAGILALGVLSIWLLKPFLELTDAAADRNVLALFVPFGCVAVLILWVSLRNQWSRWVGGLVVLMYVMLSFNLYDFFFEPIWHFHFDDPGRYSSYAHLILSSGTLWGGDAIGSMGIDSAVYVDQPGYRYFLAAMIGLLGGEHRLLQMANMGLYLVAVTTFLIGLSTAEKRISVPIAVFLAASLPYAANNILEGLSEWFAISLVLLAMTVIKRRQYYWAIVVVGLVVFVRQNYILFCGALILIVIVSEKQVGKKIGLGLLACLSISLPVIHNWVFGGEIRFFALNRGTLIHWDRDLGEVWLQVVSVLWWKLKTYFGYWSSADSVRTLLAVMFAPLGSVLILYLLFIIKGINRWLYFLMITVVAGPTMLYGWGYFPRFVFANQAILLSVAPLILSWQRASLGERDTNSKYLA